MEKIKLRASDIHFAIMGYFDEPMNWIENTVTHFEAQSFPLKSIDYGIHLNESGNPKEVRQSLKTFHNQANHDGNYFNITLFAGNNQKFPATWHYGLHFVPSYNLLTLFFNTAYPEENVWAFYRSYLQMLLSDKAVWYGYAFKYRKNSTYQQPQYGDTLGYYKENPEPWQDFIYRQDLKQYLESINYNFYRHIYPQNILSKHHLTDGFEEWITSNDYGVLEKIGIENWLWTVRGNNKLRDVQVAFYDKRLLIGVTK